MENRDTKEPESRKDYWLDRLARKLANPHFSTGEHAALRRMNPRRPGSGYLPFVRIAEEVGLTSIDGPSDRDALIVHCLALVRGRHSSAVPIGKGLCDIYFSEARLCQLLAADLDVLFDIIPRLARRFASAGIAVDWWPLVNLVRYVGLDEEKADEARQTIARSYVRALQGGQKGND